MTDWIAYIGFGFMVLCGIGMIVAEACDILLSRRPQPFDGRCPYCGGPCHSPHGHDRCQGQEMATREYGINWRRP